jgi:hypothetical protein
MKEDLVVRQILLDPAESPLHRVSNAGQGPAPPLLRGYVVYSQRNCWVGWEDKMKSKAGKLRLQVECLG